MITLLRLKKPLLHKSCLIAKKTFNLQRFQSFSEYKASNPSADSIKSDPKPTATFYINDSTKIASTNKSDNNLSKPNEGHFSPSERKYNMQILRHLKQYVLPYNNPNGNEKH